MIDERTRVDERATVDEPVDPGGASPGLDATPSPGLDATPSSELDTTSSSPGLDTTSSSPGLDTTSSSAGFDATSRSALADALAAVGDRWTLLVIAALLDGPRRFGDLQEAVAGIAPNVLTQRLRQLERNALVVARPYSERPPRFVYELSAAGRELAGALRLLAGWGARNAEGGIAPLHGVCGTPMEARWWCPTCERIVSDDEDEELHFA